MRSVATLKRSTKSVVVMSVGAAAMCALFVLLSVGSSGPPENKEPAGKWLNVVGTVPLKDEVLANRILIFFDGTLVAPKAGEPGASTPVLSIQPDVRGSVQLGDTYLLFQPAVAPQSATPSQPAAPSWSEIVRIELNPELRSTDGRKLNPAQRKLTFATFLFEPQALWAVAGETGRTTLAVRFPAAIEVDALRQRLSVKASDGRDVAFRLEPGGDPKTARLSLDNNSPWPVTITIAKGLLDSLKLFRTDKDYTYTYPSTTLLQVNAVRWGRYEAGVQAVVIDFSKPVQRADLTRYLTLKDLDASATVPYEISAWSEQRFELSFQLAKPSDARLLIEIAKGLPGAEMTLLPQPYTKTLDMKVASIPLVVQSVQWATAGREGLVLSVRFNKPVEAGELQKHLELSPAVANLRATPLSYGGLQLRGDWESDQPYELRITPGMKYGLDEVLNRVLSYSTKSQRLPAYLGFSNPGKFYFPRQGAQELTLSTRNVKNPNITVSRMFPSNIAVAVETLGNGDQAWNFSRAWCEELLTTSVTLQAAQGKLVETPLDLKALLPQNRRGVFCIEATAKREQTVGPPYDYSGSDRFATKLVVLTRIGLLAHWQDDELVLFAHDLYSLAPLNAARVSVYSTKNQLMGKGATDERGIVHMRELNTALGKPHVAVVEHGTDYTFLDLEPRRDGAYQLDRSLTPYDRKGYDAFLYADRQLYRPGEPVHLRWIVRHDYGDALENVPLLLTIVKPNRQNLLSQAAVLSALGTGGLDLETQKGFATGRYEVRLSVPGSEKAIGTYTFNLEEFVPNRIKATVTVPELHWVTDRDHEIRVNAQHLFGAAAEGRKCDATVRLARAPWKPAGWKGFRFDNDSAYAPPPVQCGETTTDKDGNAVLTFHYSSPRQVGFPMKAEILARVYEMGGRSVTARAETVVFPTEICLGVSAAASSRDQKGIEVFAAAIAPDEKPANLDKVEITLERQVWNYYVRRYYGYYGSDWSGTFQPIETRSVTLAGGRGSAVFSPEDYGYYRVRVHSPKTNQYSTLGFYACYGRYELLDTARPSLIKVTLDKASYKPGEEAVVRVESPFDGKGILVVEGDAIEKMIPITIKKGVGLARLPVLRTNFPNVWIEATVIHGVQQGRQQVYPFSSFAAVCLAVDDPQRRLTVTLPDLPKEIKPARDVQFDVDVVGSNGMPVDAELTLAAVDEGIHSITGYRSPEPYAWLTRARLPQCLQANYYDKVAYEFEKPAAGGDGAALGRRVGAIGENWIRPVALWSGVVRTDRSGRARVTMKVPEFTGQLRLVAVACTPRAVGACSQNIFVRRPYTLQVSVPRFLLPGDSVEAIATVFNRANSGCKAKISWSVSGALREGQGSRAVEIASQKELSVTARFTAGNATGQGEMRWEAVITDAAGAVLETLTQVLPLPVRPPAAFQSYQELVTVKPGETRTFRNVKFLDDDLSEVELAVSPSPLLRLGEALGYVVGYPYGCVEQTTSRLMPMYLLRKAGPFLKAVLPNEESVDAYIQAGISRLLSMQTPSGGLGFWPGDEQPYPYGSVYALHFLTLVKSGREFDLPAQSITALQEYVRGLANDSTNNSASGLYLRAYAVYVLALDGDLKAIQMIDRFDELTLPRPARFLLAGALARNTKDRDRVMLYLTKPSAPYEVREPDGTLNSDIRGKAIELLMLRQIGGSPQQALERANELIAFLEKHHYGSTQETAFVVTALAGFLSELKTNVDVAAATVIAGGKESAIRKDQTWRGAQKGKGAAIAVANTGQSDIFVSWTSRGIPERAEPAAAAKGVSVRRVFRTSAGDPASSAAIRQGETYIVGVEVNCDDTVKNLIVVDLLPAGLEVENPRLNTAVLPGKPLPNATTPSYLEIRDDRVVLAFDTASRGTHCYYYAVNAVTPGKYQYPAAAAECMYDASVRGTSAGGMIEVKQGM